MSDTDSPSNLPDRQKRYEERRQRIESTTDSDSSVLKPKKSKLKLKQNKARSDILDIETGHSSQDNSNLNDSQLLENSEAGLNLNLEDPLADNNVADLNNSFNSNKSEHSNSAEMAKAQFSPTDAVFGALSSPQKRHLNTFLAKQVGNASKVVKVITINI